MKRSKIDTSKAKKSADTVHKMSKIIKFCSFLCKTGMTKKDTKSLEKCKLNIIADKIQFQSEIDGVIITSVKNCKTKIKK